MKNNKISSYPPVMRTAKDFILDAEKDSATNTSDKNSCYPWMESGVRHDVQKVFSVKLLEEYIIKIRFISEVTNKSQQKIVRDIIKSEVDKILRSIGAG
jgi:hypothetical protein